MNDSKRYFHPETVKRIARLELRSRYIVEGFLSGMHRSPFFGQSIEFRQHRDYVYGDDLRHVDWKVWARQDRLYVKQYEEDTNLTCTLLVDRSESMSVGSGVFTKFEYGATLACCLAYLVNRQKDAVGCATFDEALGDQLAASRRGNQLQTIAASLDRTTLNSKTEIGKVLLEVGSHLDHCGLVVLISDFLDDLEQIKKGLRALRQRGHDVILLQILDPHELTFPFTGPTHFEGLESESELRCNPSVLRKEYLKAMQEFLHDLKWACARSRCDYTLISTDDRFDAVLAKLLDRRMAMRRP